MSDVPDCIRFSFFFWLFKGMCGFYSKNIYLMPSCGLLGDRSFFGMIQSVIVSPEDCRVFVGLCFLQCDF